jgi:hypothetical protein
MNESAYCYDRLWMDVWMCVCDVCGSRPEFLNEDNPVWPKICSIHLVIRHTKPGKNFHRFHVFISISGSKCGGGMENPETVTFNDRLID